MYTAQLEKFRCKRALQITQLACVLSCHRGNNTPHRALHTHACVLLYHIFRAYHPPSPEGVQRGYASCIHAYVYTLCCVTLSDSLPRLWLAASCMLCNQCLSAAAVWTRPTLSGPVAGLQASSMPSYRRQHAKVASGVCHCTWNESPLLQQAVLLTCPVVTVGSSRG